MIKVLLLGIGRWGSNHLRVLSSTASGTFRQRHTQGASLSSSTHVRHPCYPSLHQPVRICLKGGCSSGSHTNPVAFRPVPKVSGSTTSVRLRVWHECRVEGKGRYFIRIISPRIANWVCNKLSDENFSNAGGAYRAFKRECLTLIKFFKGAHRFLPTLFKMEGFPVTEIPVTNNPRFAGQGHYGVWNRLFKSLTDLLAIRWMKKQSIHYEIIEKRNLS
ncbi:MAG TPA: hypothetical protein ACFYD4_14675 [Candidatus Wunengus sp. YC61]|uniref:hypothetical protein n=1 Tax=Candidatus Wunengus sp. YC61 TaxID=3367698 RepID=UPI004028223C